MRNTSMDNYVETLIDVHIDLYRHVKGYTHVNGYIYMHENNDSKRRREDSGNLPRTIVLYVRTGK